MMKVGAGNTPLRTFSENLNKVDFDYLQCGYINRKPGVETDLRKLNEALDTFKLNELYGKEYVTTFGIFRKLLNRLNLDNKINSELKEQLSSKISQMIK